MSRTVSCHRWYAHYNADLSGYVRFVSDDSEFRVPGELVSSVARSIPSIPAPTEQAVEAAALAMWKAAGGICPFDHLPITTQRLVLDQARVALTATHEGAA